MKSALKNLLKKPILLLIAVNIVIGLFVFRDYGLSWDEPLFYDYGDALGYAYSPKEWFSGHFDLYNSYGASGDDHKTRGPAYLFLARNFVYGLNALGSDKASAWHLVNFLFFQLGIYFLYRFAKRWVSKPAAFFTAVFFSYQPLLWGHAFINPKDPPFLTFFLASVCLGFEMVDSIAQDAKDRTKKILLASFFLGIGTSIRVLGPFAGLLVFIYFLYKLRGTVNPRPWRSFIGYGLLAVGFMFVTWPYLWEDPVRNFFHVFQFMSDNPTNLSILFDGNVLRASELPRRYLPTMLTITLTEPTLPLFIMGILLAVLNYFKERSSNGETQRDELISLALILLWLITLLAYVLIRKPAMYDGIRHFLFILPPLFIFIGFAFQFIVDRIPSTWLRAGLVFLLVLPGISGIVRLHPYQYTYYNSFVGGTDGAFRDYETDYWLTCYKDAVEELKDKTNRPINLFVKREAYIAEFYANDHINVQALRGAVNEVRSGVYVLVNSRTNEDLSTFKDAPIVIEVKRGEATFCIIRQIP